MDGFLSIYDEVIGVWGLLGLFGLALVVSTLGALAGLLTRNMMLLFVVFIGAAAFVMFHDHLPLPNDMHRQLDDVKGRFE